MIRKTLAALILTFATAASIYAQGTVPVRRVTTIPTKCNPTGTVSDVLVWKIGTPNRGLHGCTATDTWTHFGAAAGTFTAKGMIYVDANGLLASTAAATNGQLLCGSTGAIPTLCTMTGGTGITVTLGAGSITIASTLTGTAWYGDGSDGAVTADGAGSPACLGVPTANIYTMTRDCYFTNLTVNVTVTIDTAGFRIFATGVFSNAGTIRDDGAAGIGPTAGAGGTGGVFLAGTSGGNGGTNAVGDAGTDSESSISGAGGAGGAGGGNAGGAAGLVTPPVASDGTPRNILQAANGRALTPTTLFGYGSGGGGGGSSAAMCDGGGGGGGGGSVLIFGKTITNTGTISARGGAGAAGGGTLGDCGGGGGGGGGQIVLAYNTLTGGTITVAGGSGGSAFNSGVAGTAGAAGKRIDFNNSN